MSLATTAIAVTLIVYVPAFFISGANLGVTNTFSDCNSLLDIFTCIVDGIGFFIGLVFLAGFTDIDATFRILIVFAMFLMWGLIILGQVRGSSQQ